MDVLAARKIHRYDSTCRGPIASTPRPILIHGGCPILQALVPWRGTIGTRVALWGAIASPLPHAILLLLVVAVLLALVGLCVEAVCVGGRRILHDAQKCILLTDVTAASLTLRLNSCTG